MTPPVNPDLRVLHKDDLKELLEAAAEDGATKALAAVGLTRENAEDIRTSIAIARGVREAQREIWRTIGKGLVFAVVIGCATWLGSRLGVIKP